MKRLLQYLPKPSITIITGRRGGGKTAKAFSLASALHVKTKKKVYLHKPEKVVLPSYFKQLDIKKIPGDSIILLDDAHLYIHAREWYDDFNLMIDKLQTISRRLNVDIVYTTQQSYRIDKNIIAGVDCLVFCEPSILDEGFERGELKELVREANQFFLKILPRDRVKAAYVVTHQIKKGFLNIKLPYYWSRDLSLSYGLVKVDKKEVLKVMY